MHAYSVRWRLDNFFILVYSSPCLRVSVVKTPYEQRSSAGDC